jgi:hypothetical protein
MLNIYYLNLKVNKPEMRFTLRLIAACLLYFLMGSTYSQKYQATNARIDNVDWTYEDDEVIISYDIVSTESWGRFDIQVNIYDDAGNNLNAKSFSGDLKSVTPGNGKKIYWQISSDVLFLYKTIQVEIIAYKLKPLSPVGYTSKGKALALSTAFPGWGSAKISSNNIHFVKGALAYSAVAAGTYYFIKGNQTYNKYLDSYISDERSRYFDDAKTQFTVSKICFITGVCLWLADYATILLSPNRSSKSGNISEKISIYPAIDPLWGESLLVMTIAF